VLGLDLDAELVDELGRRAAGLPAEAVMGDARAFELGTQFGLVLAPMQLLQLFASSEERTRLLRCAARHLRAGGLAASAIVESMLDEDDASPPAPDTREIDGRVYSSLPIELLVDSEAICMRRLRQVVSPAGELSEEVSDVYLRRLDAATLEREARAAGLLPAGRRPIPMTNRYVGSTAVLLEGGR
jgi:hypothetical protein